MNCSCCITKGDLENRAHESQKNAETFKLLSSSSKIELLFVLNECCHCVNDMCCHTEMSQSLVSHHLSDLAGLGLVEGKKRGKFVEYELTDKGSAVITTISKLTELMKGGEEIEIP